MKIIIAPDSFKGSVSALDVAKNIEAAVHSVDATAETVLMPVADGGEGTVDAIASCVPAQIHKVTVCGPMKAEAEAYYATIEDGKTAVIEMAQASGLPRVPVAERNPLCATTYGTGQLMKDALDRGVKKMIIGIGGSATNDGGAGALSALGASFLSENGKELSLGGGNLAELKTIDLSQFDKRIYDTEIVVACDVTNPLTGPTGASYIYGPQKGATPEMVEKLDQALDHFADVSKEVLGEDFSA